MYAVVKLGSSQYKISQGENIDVQLLGKKDGEKVHLDKILLFVDGRTVKVGQPYLKDVKVEAEVIQQVLGEKTIAFKYRRRKNSKWTKGHRQKLNALHITKISVSDKSS